MPGGRQQVRVDIRESEKPVPRVMVDGREGPVPELREAMPHENRVYVDDQKRVHIALSAPLYLRVALSPDDNDPNYLLHGPVDSQVALPFYLDGPGKHNISHPGGRGGPGFTAYVYADASPPVSTLMLAGAKMHASGNGLYFSNGLQAEIEATDDMTGVQNIFYTLGDSLYSPYKAPIAFTAEKAYRIRYYAVDNVGNPEAVGELSFTVDASSPSIEARFSSSAVTPGETPVYAAGVVLEMEADDALSGVARLAYAVNEAPEKLYETPVRFETPGDYTVVIRAADRVGNSENQILRFKVN